MNTMVEFAYEKAVAEICDLDWPSLGENEVIGVAWAYYYFSIQFRENLLVARMLHPHDDKLQELELEECNTDNLSPWPAVAEVNEKMDHDEFMRRVLALAPVKDAERVRYEMVGSRYLDMVRDMDDKSRALSIASYEDGGLEQVFRAMLTSPVFENPLLQGFRHFLIQHIKFDSDPSLGHGAMIRHLRPDDRILPLWTGFKDLLIQCVPHLVNEAI